MTADDPTALLPPPPPTTTPPTAPPPAPRPAPPSGPPAPPHRRGAGWVVLGSVLAVVLVGWGAWSTLSLLGRQVRTERTVIDEPVDVLEIHAAGPIRVVASTSERVTITERVERSIVQPRRSQETIDGRLVLRSSCTGISNFCSVGYTVSVPTDTRLVLRSDSDSIRVEQIDGLIDASSSGGAVTVIGGSGDLRLRSWAGGVTVAESRSADVQATSTAGSVALELAAAPNRVDASSSAGRVSIVVPRSEVAYAVDASSSASGTEIAVRTDPASSRTIRASSSAGSVTVRYP